MIYYAMFVCAPMFDSFLRYMPSSSATVCVFAVGYHLCYNHRLNPSGRLCRPIVIKIWPDLGHHRLQFRGHDRAEFGCDRSRNFDCDPSGFCFRSNRG